MKNIVILDAHTVNPGDISWDDIKEHGNLSIYPYTSRDEIDERLKDADIVLIYKTRLVKQTLQKHPRIKYIGTLATGYDNVDLNYCKEAGIRVCNIPSYSSYSVAQMVFALLFEVTNFVNLHNESIKKGEWNKYFTYWKKPLVELFNMNIGLIGNGNIAKRVASIAHSLGMNVLIYSRKELKDENTIRYVTLDQLYKESDIISLHVPSNEETIGMINEESINKMKDDVIIINTARGNLVKTLDIDKALRDRKVKYFLSDVLEKEPPIDNPLLNNEFCILTPHIAWAPSKTRARLVKIAADNIKMFLEGRSQNIIV